MSVEIIQLHHAILFTPMLVTLSGGWGRNQVFLLKQDKRKISEVLQKLNEHSALKLSVIFT